MVHPLSRNAASLWLVSAVAVTWTSVSSAEPPGPDPDAASRPAPQLTLPAGLADDLEGRVKRLLPSLADTIQNLHLKNRAIEYRQPLAWEGHALELRVRGGRFKGKGRHGARAYGLRVELRF